MTELISAADANRNFSRILRTVGAGASYTVTSHGRAVARIVPADDAERKPVARAALLRRLEAQEVVDIGPWQRQSLYDR